MDPVIVNKKTCRGDIGYEKAHMIDVVTTVVRYFVQRTKRASF
jgi:hypothetical protein